MKTFVQIIALNLLALCYVQGSPNGYAKVLIHAQEDSITYQKGIISETARLFSDKDNSSSVVLYVPKDSVVEILGAEDAYFLVRFKGIEGFILQRKVQGYENIRNSFYPPEPANTQQMYTPSEDRLSSFIQKYGENNGKKIAAHKIWRGMTREMVKDSWGKPKAINLYNTRMTRREEWVYKHYILVFENGILDRWK